MDSLKNFSYFNTAQKLWCKATIGRKNQFKNKAKNWFLHA
jgi:hypothetical protein